MVRVEDDPPGTSPESRRPPESDVVPSGVWHLIGKAVVEVAKTVGVDRTAEGIIRFFKGGRRRVCPKCKKKILAKDKYCPECGYEQSGA